MFAKGEIQLSQFSCMTELRLREVFPSSCAYKTSPVSPNGSCPIRSINYSLLAPGALATTQEGESTINVDEADTGTRSAWFGSPVNGYSTSYGT